MLIAELQALSPKVMHVLPLNCCPLAWQAVEPSAVHGIQLLLYGILTTLLRPLAQPLIKQESVRKKKENA